jgi:hypothetical protein
MIGISLLDKSHSIKNQFPNDDAKNKSIKLGWQIIAVSVIVGVIAAFFVVPMRNLAIEAIYVLVVGFLLIGTILILNSSSRTMNEKGLIIERSLFKTTDTFNIAAIGICGILAVLYGFFW